MRPWGERPFRILATSRPIPADVLCASTSLGAGRRAHLAERLRATSREGEAGRQLLAGLGATALVPFDAEVYERFAEGYL